MVVLRIYARMLAQQTDLFNVTNPAIILQTLLSLISIY